MDQHSRPSGRRKGREAEQRPHKGVMLTLSCQDVELCVWFFFGGGGRLPSPGAGLLFY
jgi:hypothetical protein